MSQFYFSILSRSKVFLVVLGFFLSPIAFSQTTVTLNCTGPTGSYNSGTVTSGGVKAIGNMVDIDGASATKKQGWATFDLSSIPIGSTVNSVTFKFTVYSNNALSTIANKISVFTGDPLSMTGATLYSNIVNGTVANTSTWAQNGTNSKTFDATGLTYVSNSLGGRINIGLWRGAGTALFRIGGYPYTSPPQLIINYTPPAYRAQFTAMNTGVATWCAGETRTVSVTVKNIGTQAWADAGGRDFNLGVKWNAETDYFVRTDIANLAPGATQTFNLDVTAPSTTGTNNLTFDLVWEGVTWFGNNGGGVGPGNVVFKSSNLTINAVPAAPAAAATQVFCTSATVADLKTTSGANIKWYDAQIGGTALATSTALVNGAVYYASQTNTSGCESSLRRAVTVTISTPAAPTGTAAQSFCAISAPKVSNLTPAGTGIKWYTTASGGTALPTTTALASGHYYASQTISGCESTDRLDVTVSVDDPSAPTGAATQNFCFINAPKVSDLVVTGTDVKWYTDPTGGTALATTAALATNTYYASQTIGGCESATRLAVAVTVGNPAAPTGTSPQIFCASDNPTVANLTAAGTDIKWYDAATGGNLVPNATALVHNTRYYASQTIDGCESATRLNVLVTVNAAVVINTQPIPSQTKCVSSSVTFTVGAANAAGYQWYFGSVPLIDNGNITGSQTATLKILETVSADAGLYRVVIIGRTACGDATSDDAELSINENLLITDQPAAQTLCVGSTATFEVISGGSNLTYKWRKGSVFLDAVSNPSAETAILTLTNITTTEAGSYSVLVSDGAGVGCTERYSTSAVLTVNATSVGGIVNGSTAKCSGTNSGNLTLAGRVGNVTDWEFSTDAGATWITVSPANTTTTLSYSNLIQTTYYRAVVKSGVCAPAYSTEGIITVNPIPDAIASETFQTICSGNPITAITLTGSVPGTVFNWVRTPTTGISGIATSGAGDISGSLINSTANPITVTFTITPVTPTTPACTGSAITATVLVNPTPVVTVTPAMQNICSGNAIATITSTSTTTNPTIAWTRDNPAVTGTIGTNGSGNISGTLINTSNAPVTVTFTITPTSENGCVGASKTVTVVVSPLPAITPAASAAGVCFKTTAQTTTLAYSNATNTPTKYSITWSGTFANITDANLPASPITINVPANAPAGTYTGTITVKNANNCVSGTGATFTVTVNPAPAANGGGDIVSCLSAIPMTGATASGTYGSVSWTGGIGLGTFSGTGTDPSTYIFTPSTPQGSFTATLTVTGSSVCNGTNATATRKISWGSAGSWLGTVSTDWFDAANWCGGRPTATSDVTIPAVGSVPYQPVIGGAGAVVRNITLNGTLSTITTNNLDVFGDWINNGVFTNNTGSVTFRGGTGSTLAGTSATTFNNLIVNKTAKANTLNSSSKAFTATNLTVTQGNLILSATDADYVVSNNITVPANGILTHSVNWDAAPNNLLSVGGNIAVDGIYNYTTRSHVSMTGSGKTVYTGNQTGSAFSILTLAQTGTITAAGTLTVDDNFWAMFGTAGTFTTGSNTVTANAGFLMNNGTVNLNGGTLNVTGGVAVGSGAPATFNLSAGTLNADGLTIGTSNAVYGRFNLTGGIANIGDLKISSTTSTTNTSRYTVSGSSPSIINITGAWTNDGTNAGNSFTAGNSQVNFMGTATQTIGGATVTTFNNLSINNENHVNLARNTNVSGILNLTNGLVTTGAHTIAVTTSGNTITGYSSNSYVNGILSRAFVAGASNNIFPVGKDENYRPLTLTYGSGNGAKTVAVEQFESQIPGTIPGNNVVFPSRYWTITQSGGSTNLNYKVTLDPTGYTPVGSNIKILKKEGNTTLLTAHDATSPDYTNITSFTTFNSGQNGTNSFALAHDCSSAANAGLALADFCQGRSTPGLGGSVSGTATGGTWTSSAGGTFSPNANTLNATWTPPANFYGTATLTLTPTGGLCPPNTVATKTVNVIQGPSGTVTVSETSGLANNDRIICAGASVRFTAPSGFQFYNFYKLGQADTLYKGTSNVLNTSTLNNGDQIMVIVANSNNCAITIGPILMAVTPLPTPTLSASKTTICAGEPITFTATGGAAGTTYNFKVNNATVQNSTSNTYTTAIWSNNDKVTVEVINENKCVGISSEIIVTVNPLPTGTFTSTNTSVCAGESITFTATGGVEYQFSVNGTVAQTFSSTATFSSSTFQNGDVVTVEVKNAAGCIATYPNYPSIPVSINPLPTGTITITENSGTPNDHSICANTPVTYTFPTGYKNYDFRVNGTTAQSSASNTYTNTTLQAGDVVTLIVQSNSNCTATFNANAVTINPSPSGTLSVSDNTICAGDNVTFTATDGAGNTYNFKINCTQASVGTSNIFTTSSLANGDIVTVEVTNANSCMTIFNAITMMVTALPTGTMTITETSGIANNEETICAGAEVIFTAPAGFSNYNFLLNGSSVQDGSSVTYTTMSLANSNKVTVAVTNAGGCIALLNEFTMTVNPLPAVTAVTGPAEVCAGQNITLANTTSGGKWSSSNAAIATVDENSGIVTGVAEGTVDILYTVTNTTTNCSNIALRSITVNALPAVAAITGDLNVCVGNVTTLSSATNGGVWSSDDTNIATIDGDGNVTGVADGTLNISYTVTNAKGCVTVVTKVMNVHALPVLTAIAGRMNVCIGATETLTNSTTGGAWTSSDPATAIVNGSTGVVTGIAAGTTTITYTYSDGNSCVSSVTADVVVNPLPVPTLAGPKLICLGSTDNVYTTESGQASYSWNIVNGTVTSGGTTSDPTVTISWLSAGVKSISVNYVDANGCAGATVATVENAAGSSPVVAGPTAVCLNSEATYTTKPGMIDYNWTVTGGDIIGGGDETDNTVTILWTGIGNKSVTVNYAEPGGCSAATPTVYTVSVKPLPTATMTLNTANVCENATNPTITFRGAGSTAPYTFTYEINGGMPQTIVSMGANATLSVPTNVPGTFIYTLLSVQDASATSCSQAQSGVVTITVAPTPSATISYAATPVCRSSGAISVTHTGTTGGTYSSTSGLVINPTTGEITPSTSNPGTYTITYRVAAAGGCAVYATTTQVTITAAPVATITYTAAPFCATATPKNVTRTGSTSGTYSSTTGLIIDAGTGQITPSTSTPGTYTVTYTIAASGGCAEFSTTTDVTITAAPTATIAYSASPYCTGTGTASVTRTGTAGGTYTATPAGLTIDAATGNINLASSAGGSYTVTYSIGASGGCAAISTTANVVINTAPTAIAGTSAVLTCANSGAVNITAGSTATNYSSVLWTSSGTGTIANGTSLTTATYNPSAADITAGSVTLTLRANGNSGCSFVTSTKTMTISQVPPAFLIEPASATLCEGDVQTLSASGGTSGTGSMTFTSSGGNNNRVIPSPGNTTSSINLSGLPPGATVTSVDVKFNISHGYTGELILNLKAPNGNILNLVNQRGGGSGAGFNTTIRSSATNNINGTAPFNGVYRADRAMGIGAPQTSTVNTFTQLLGTMTGNWVLSAYDPTGCRGSIFGWCYGGDYDGQINNWSITVNYNVPVDPLSVTWSPMANLFTDIETTIPYAGQDLSTVYAKPAPGTATYTATQTNSSGCSTTKSVNLVTSSTPVVKITANYCDVPGFVQLTASSTPAAATYLWSNGATASVIQVDESGTYDVQAWVSGSSCPGEASIGVSTELVTNGDFESGPTGFVTDYRNRTGVYYTGSNATGLYPEGDFAVDKSAYSPSNGTGYHRDFHGRDHTTGTGNFMMVNGSRNIIKIWEQTVNVLPNTDYYFSAWAMNLNPGSPARLRFEVNGEQVGTIAELNSAPKPTTEGQVALSNWVRFYSNPTWKSGPTTTTAVIRIINLNTAEGGNDFGLDDISFGTLSTFIQLVSAPGTDGQTVCKASEIENILYNVGNGSTAGPSVTGLPAGVNSVFDGDRLIITGTPTVAGNFTYTITTTGCGATTATGTITVEEQKIVLSAGNTAPVCKDALIMDRVYTLSGTATSAVVTALPAGVTGTLSGTTFTISGTPTVAAGVYPYTITTTGTCAPVSIAGSITVQEQTITLNSVPTTIDQEVCINTGIANIQYLVGGTGTGASASGLPAGVTGNYVAGVFTIRGTPTEAGIFNYTVTTTGPCGAVTATGTITVTPAATIALSSAAGTDAQVACNNLAITPITYQITNATGASITGGALPTGITGAFSGGVFTISGSTTQTGTFNYIITTNGGCATATVSGTITVNGQKIVLTSGAASPSVCTGAAMTNIAYTLSGEATGASISGQPAGVSGSLSGNTFTVSGMVTDVAGAYPYTITTSGANCTPATLTGIITVQPTAVGGTITSASTCSGGSGTLTVLGSSGTITWQVSTDGVATWNNTSPVNHTISQTYTNVTSGRHYRVEVSNNCGAVYSNISMVGVHNLWTGATDTDWQTAANWSDNQLPSITCPNVYIPNTPNQPVLANGLATIRNIYIDAGASVTVNGTGALQIAGTINNSGTFDASEGEIELNGTTAQNIIVTTFMNSAVKDLRVSNASGVNVNAPLDIYGSLEFGAATARINTNGNLTLKSNINNTARVGKMTPTHVINGEVTVERFINTGVGGTTGAHRKSWQLLAVPTDGNQTIHQSWQEDAAQPINVTTPNQSTGGNPKPGYGTMIVSNAGGAAGAIGLGFDQYTAPGPSIKVWNSTLKDYVGPPNTLSSPIYNIKGYLVLVRGDRSVYKHDDPANPTTLRSKGTLFTPAKPPLSVSVAPGLFESVGNPYASAIDLRNVTVNADLAESYSVWDPRAQGSYGLGAWVTLTKMPDGNFKATPGTTSYPGTETPYNFIESGQAFFIQGTSSSGTVSFTEEAKADESNPQLLRGQGGNVRWSQLRTNLYVGTGVNTTLADGTLLQYDGSYSNELDGKDARKLTNLSENLGLYSNNTLLSVERRAPILETDTVFLRISGMRVQPYQFEFQASDLHQFGVEGILEDKYTGSKTPMNMEGKTTYDFTIENKPGSYASDRFRIVFKAAAGPLPVTFVSVKAMQQGDDIQVDWKVENETNLKEYEAEKSFDGVRFVRTTLMPAGNQGVGAYTWLDRNVTSGWNYYRIKSIDENGKTSYSEVVKVLIEMEAPLITVYPNPIVNGVINVHLVNQPAGNYKLRLLNAQGQTMVAKQITRAKGTSMEPLTWDYKLARGNYRIEITKPDGGVKMITVIY